MPSLPKLQPQSVQIVHSVQKHDARLDRLLRVPESILMRLMARDQKTTWRLLAVRAAYIRLGLLSKYRLLMFFLKSIPPDGSYRVPSPARPSLS